MLDERTRTTILTLHQQGHGIRTIAKMLDRSRNAVRDVIRSQSSAVPMLMRAEKAEPLRDRVISLLSSCKGNLVRVHEVMHEEEKGLDLSYQALTAFCRRHGIGHEPPKPAGQYHFGPGDEMQHDTSPHTVELTGRSVKAQTASLVMAHSRMLFFQIYPNFDRFTCKVFLTEAARYFGGVAKRCMVDNTHVIVLRGSGQTMEPVPEMESFASRLGFSFVAHEKGDANRSARVERPFHFIENNFLAHRPAKDWSDLNRQARDWCDQQNATFRRHLHASPRDLFAVERQQLVPLPAHIPDPVRIERRIVDQEGYINLHRNRYSVPYRLLGRGLEVHETYGRVEVFEGPRIVASHERVIDPGATRRVTDPAHRPSRAERESQPPSPDQRALQALPSQLTEWLDALASKMPGRRLPAGRVLLRMHRDYPAEPLAESFVLARQHGLFDLMRIERMVLQRIASDFFPHPHERRPPDE